jgi:CBS domain-containing protein
MKMKIKEIMHKIIKITSEATIAQAAEIMDKKNIGSILVDKEGRLVGIVTERDILRKIVAKGEDYNVSKVKDIMTSPLITIDAESTLEQANKLMQKEKIRRLLLTEKLEIVGIITARDIATSIRYSLAHRIKKPEHSYFHPDYDKTI